MKSKRKKGPGRPVGWRKKNALRTHIMIRLSLNLSRWLVESARLEGVSRSEIVRRALMHALRTGAIK